MLRSDQPKICFLQLKIYLSSTSRNVCHDVPLRVILIYLDSIDVRDTLNLCEYEVRI
jgi:hypothetical protein